MNQTFGRSRISVNQAERTPFETYHFNNLYLVISKIELNFIVHPDDLLTITKLKFGSIKTVAPENRNRTSHLNYYFLSHHMLLQDILIKDVTKYYSNSKIPLGIMAFAGL